jgi:hypothetical protein
MTRQQWMHQGFQVGIKLENLQMLFWLWTATLPTNRLTSEIKQLYLNFDEYDKKPLMFSPRYKKAKGRFLKKKKTGHVGTEAMARYVKWKTKLTIFILGRRLVSAAVWMEKSCL